MNSAKKNNLSVSSAKNVDQAIKYISSKQKKTIVILGSLYLVGSVLDNN